MKRFKNYLAAVLGAAIIFPCFASIPVHAATKVPVNESTFPDPIFRQCILDAFDKDHNYYLTDDELIYAMNIHCENLGVESIQGVEYFYNLEGLWCKGNKIESWDLSQNKHLKGVWCSYNPLTYLDFSANKELEWIYCFECDLYGLDVSENTELAFLECNLNPHLSELDLSNNRKLENLFCSNCALTELDLSNNPLLCELACFYNDLEYLDVSKNTRLKRLDYWHNERLGNVDVTNLKELQYLNCAWTNLTSVNVTKNPELCELVCGYNKGLTSLDLSKNPELCFLTVECDVNLQKLDISHNPKLYYLMAFGLSSIDTIDISSNYRLCKTYNEGVYAHSDPDKVGAVHSYSLNYGGSGDPFDQLMHIIALDDGKPVNAKYKGPATPVVDCYLNTNDGLSNSESFATREQAVQLLYEYAGSPAVYGKSRFTDVPAGSFYEDAIIWAEDNNICFGYPMICSDTFGMGQLINREDFALMAHRFAGYMGLGTAMDYGRTDWFDDYLDVDFYGWVAFTWAYQFDVLKARGNKLYPHGRLTISELENGAAKIFNLDEAASYSARVGGNYGADYVAPSAPNNSGYTGNKKPNVSNYPSNSGSAFTPSNSGNSGSTNKPSSGTSGSSSKPGTSGSSSSPYGGDSSKPSVQVTFTPVENTSGGFGDFVERLYVVALGRASEPEGKAFWVEHVGNGDLTGAQCANEFLLSKEFNDRYLDDENFLKVLYGTFFNRKAEDDKDGFDFWMNSLKTQGRATVVDCFINSTEWCNVCASYGVKSGATRAKATIASKNATNFATRLYTECLGRDPESEGLNFWSLGLTNLELTGSQAAHEFFFSKEFNDHNYNNNDLITRMYKTFMGREPDTDGMNYWLGQMSNGMTKEQVFNEFVKSKEFTEICNEYAISRG